MPIKKTKPTVAEIPQGFEVLDIASVPILLGMIRDEAKRTGAPPAGIVRRYSYYLNRLWVHLGGPAFCKGKTQEYREFRRVMIELQPWRVVRAGAQSLTLEEALGLVPLIEEEHAQEVQESGEPGPAEQGD